MIRLTPRARPAWIAAASVLVLGIAFWNFDFYFREYSSRYMYAGFHRGEEATALGRYLDGEGDGAYVYFQALRCDSSAMARFGSSRRGCAGSMSRSSWSNVQQVPRARSAGVCFWSCRIDCRELAVVRSVHPEGRRAASKQGRRSPAVRHVRAAGRLRAVDVFVHRAKAKSGTSSSLPMTIGHDIFERPARRSVKRMGCSDSSPLELRRMSLRCLPRTRGRADGRRQSSRVHCVGTLEPSRQVAGPGRRGQVPGIDAASSDRSRRRRVPLSFLPPVTYRDPTTMSAFLAASMSRRTSCGSWEKSQSIVTTRRAPVSMPLRKPATYAVPRPSLPER